MGFLFVRWLDLFFLMLICLFVCEVFLVLGCFCLVSFGFGFFLHVRFISLHTRS